MPKKISDLHFDGGVATNTQKEKPRSNSIVITFNTLFIKDYKVFNRINKSDLARCDYGLPYNEYALRYDSDVNVGKHRSRIVIHARL